MAEEFFYPELDTKTLKNLEVVRQLSSEHPSYWLTAPYSGEVEKLCTEWFKPKKVVHEIANSLDEVEVGDGGDWNFLYRETKYLYDQLKVAGVSMDPTDKMAYFRTATSLMEKLLGMQERANNLKQISDFYQTIMDIMEAILSPTQRTEVMERLDLAMKGA